MDLICERMLSVSIPSLRRAAMRKLSESGMKQSEIAIRFGVSQAMVSKALPKRRGDAQERLVSAIIKSGIHKPLVKAAQEGIGTERINSIIDRAASCKEMSAILHRLYAKAPKAKSGKP
jgi:predicted transcriptional regulator